MEAAPTFAERLQAWADERPDVKALIQIGSRARDPADALRRSDPHSDWDFHLLTTRPERFHDRRWTAELGAGEPLAYSLAPGRVGFLPRISAVFPDADVDLMVIPLPVIAAVRRGLKAGSWRRPGRVQEATVALAVVVRPGYRFLKGNAVWEQCYREACEQVPDPRLGDAAIASLAEAFYCHWVWVERKLERGELVAVGRLLMREMAETNFRLLHELKLRRGEPSFPEARRIERVAAPAELAAVTVEIRLEAPLLRAQSERAAGTLRWLVRELIGDRWRWPQRPS